MRKAVNLRLDEQVIFALNHLSHELQTTKTDIIEKAIIQFGAQHTQTQHALHSFAGRLTSKDSDAMLEAIVADKSTKEPIEF